MAQWFRAASVIVALLPGPVASAGEPPLAGCYRRVYDAAHLAAHPGQIVAWMTLSVKSTGAVSPADKLHPVDANLKIGARAQKSSFDSLGACQPEGDGLLCNGSLSAAEADACKSKTDGIHNCRIDDSNAGSFRVTGSLEGVLVTISERLELVSAPYDAGPFLYLSPNNHENNRYLLRMAPASVCE